MSSTCSSPSRFTAGKLTYSSPLTSSSVYTAISTLPVHSSPVFTSSPVARHSTENKLTNLRVENSQLLTQSQRLMTELESTSTQLNKAKRKIHSLENKQSTDLLSAGSSPAHSRGDSSHLIISPLSNHTSPGTSVRLNDREDEWSVKQKALQDQLSDVQEECRRLKTACIDVEQRTSRRRPVATTTVPAPVSQHQLFDRPLSSQSWRGPVPSSLPYYTTDTPTSVARSHSDYPTYTSTYKPLDKSLSGSNTSLSSVRSAREPLNHYTSLTGGSHGNGISVLELEKSKSKVRKLERQVTVLERQLKDKTRASEGHVEELTKLRSQLAQEKASNAITQHQTQEKAAGELGRIRAQSVEKNNEQEVRLTTLTGHKNRLEKELEKSRDSLKSCQDENKLISDRFSKLVRQLEEERTSHRSSLDHLRRESSTGHKRVGDLERELNNCRLQLRECLSDVEREKERKEGEHNRLDQQVKMFSEQLLSCKDQLNSAGQTIGHLTSIVEEREREIRELRETEDDKRAEMVSQLKQGSTGRENLLRQLESANAEILMLSQRVTGLQEGSLRTHQLEGEVGELRRALSEHQSQRMRLEQVKEEMEGELGRYRGEEERGRDEGRVMKTRLEQSSQQLGDMQRRSEEWRVERERLAKRSMEFQLEVDSKQREITGLRSRLQQMERDRTSGREESNHTLQQELNKRTEQVMELDKLLRSQQVEAATKRQELERRLTKREQEWRTQSEHTTELREQLASLQTINEDLKNKISTLQEQRANSNVTELKQKNDLIVVLESEVANKTEAIKALNAKLSANREEIVRLGGALTRARVGQDSHAPSADLLASRDQQITRLKDQVQQLLQQERTKQEEVSRCRAQVVSLSTELSVERQMVQETRQQLVRERTSQRHATPTPTTPTSPYLPPVTSKTSLLLAAQKFNETTPKANSTNHHGNSNVIHI